MVIKQIKTGKNEGLWKATINFENDYARKGSFELFDTKTDAEQWLKAVKKQFALKKKSKK